MHDIPPKDPNTKRFVTFNVCGIKNVLNYTPWYENKSFENMFEVFQADLVCFQETKIQPRDLTKSMAMVSGYNAFFSFPTRKKGYSGVVIYVKQDLKVVKAEQGITGWLTSDDDKGIAYRNMTQASSIGAYPDIDKKSALEVDSEGRSVVLDLGSCVVIGLYCPANSTDNRDDYRQLFFETLDARVRNLVDSGRKVVVLGDLNIARDLVDSADGRQAWFQEGKITNSSSGNNDHRFIQLNSAAINEWKYNSSWYRKMLNQWIDELSLQDTSRDKFPHRRAMYTCWNVKLGARASNFGSRIDYILASPQLETTNADILPHLLGSDHCPVFADLRLPPASETSTAVPKLCAKYMPQFHNNQTLHALFARQTRERSTSSTPPDATPTTITTATNTSTTATNTTNSTNHPQKKRKTIEPAQRSLLNFFTSKSGEKEKSPSSNAASPSAKASTDSASGADDHESNPINDIVSSASGSKLETDLRSVTVFGATAKAEEWKSMFQPPKPPLCSGHKEPCKLMTTKKRGANKGRSFWVCSR